MKFTKKHGFAQKYPPAQEFDGLPKNTGTGAAVNPNRPTPQISGLPLDGLISRRPRFGRRYRPIMIGDTMSRYVIEPVAVGTGGFGKIRRGRDTDLDRDVAVKTLDPLWAKADDNDKERFRREAKTLAALSHPNIPAIYDVSFESKSAGEPEFAIYFQFIDGLDVRKLLAEGPLSIEEARGWFDQVASALEHAHSKGIIHRDIKPENMIVTKDRKHCYLVDFGLALSEGDLQRLTGSDHVVGTPGYMSPEQLEGKLLDTSDDLYVLGLCLYEALAGHKIPDGHYESLGTANETIPQAVDQLILSCIAGKPQRLRSAAEFRKRLATALFAHAPLSVVLTQGQLHEVAAILRQMNPEEFLQLPAGQRLLILEKCRDVVVEDRLAAARAEFLSILPILAIHVESQQYADIAGPAMRHGFVEEQFGRGRVGDRRIRESLNVAASLVGKENHHVLVKSVNDAIQGVDLENQQGWFFHWLRLLLTRLLANPAGQDDDAGQIADLLHRVNTLHRERSGPSLDFGEDV